MEFNPIYQGHQFSAARTPQGAISHRMPFADAWQRGQQEANRHAQRMAEALRERSDNTVLLNQSAQARANNIEMTLALKEKLQLENGADGGFYDANGKLNKAAVRDFANRYLKSPVNWSKALFTPDAKEKSMRGQMDYSLGVQQAIETAILANTKERQVKALKENMAYADRMGDRDAIDMLAQQGVYDGILSEQQCNNMRFDNEADRIKDQVNAVADLDAGLDLLEDEAWQNYAEQYNKEALSVLKRKVEEYTRTSGLPATFVTETDKKTGKQKLVKAKPVPPTSAPWYFQSHFLKYDGKFDSPDAQADGIKVMQRFLAENITEAQGSEVGDRQWADARAMADSVGIKSTEFEQLYDTRDKQISYGGFDPKAYLDAIPDEVWLRNTSKDEELDSSSLTDKETQSALRKIVADMKDAVMLNYNLWYSQNKDRKPTARDQAAEFEKHFQSALKDSPAIFHAVTANIKDNILQQEIAIDKEKRATRQRAQKTSYENLWLRRKGDGLLKKMGISLQPINATKPGTDVSRNLTFDWQFDRSNAAAGEPGYRNENVIYVPNNTKINFDEITLPTGRNKCETFYIRKGNVNNPTLSRRARIALGVTLRNPARIAWDGTKLTISNEEAPSLSASANVTYGLYPEDTQAIEEATPVSEYGDDGLVPLPISDEEING